MMNALAKWNGRVVINGTEYASISDFNGKLSGGDRIHIQLLRGAKKAETKPVSSPTEQVKDSDEVVITVKQYMTKEASPDFDFMSKWNNNNPMPLRTMVGRKIKETRGMVYMKLHGDIWAKQICTCMACGRSLTNPVSQFFGIGPECGGHNYVNPFGSDAELRDAVSQYRAKLQGITWEGWIIKSAIISEEKKEVEG